MIIETVDLEDLRMSNLNEEFQINEITPEQKKSMKSRIITALIMALVGIPALIFGGWVFFILVMALLILACSEAIHVVNKPVPVLVMVFMYIIAMYFAYWIFAKNITGQYIAARESGTALNIDFDVPFLTNLFSEGFNEIYVSSTGIITILVILFMSSFLSNKFSILDVGYFLMMSVLLGLGFQSIYYLRYSPTFAFKELVDTSDPLFRYMQSSFLMIYVLIGTIFNDIGAYFVGVLFGKHKVNPRISPKKTWEGLVGGVIISALLSTGFAILVSLLGRPMHPYLTHNEWYWILLISLLIPFLSIVGDFSFSAIKRHNGKKDFSKIFKEHGGVLDRLDSIIFSGIGASVLVVLISHGWQVFK